MGRHTQPGTGSPTPDTGFWVRLGVLGAAVAVVVGWWLVSRGGDEPVTTSGRPDASPSAATTSPGTTSSAPTSTSGSTSASPSATKRPPTLSFTVKRRSYITVRVPGGRTIVSRLFQPGAERQFDAKVLQVVNGRPKAVRFLVNGKPHQPGPADQPETFTARR